MDTFVTAHPDSDNVLYVNCGSCGAAEPLGLGFDADDAALDEAAQIWQEAHTCGEVSEFGLREYASPDVAARYFGLPDDYR